MIDEGTPIEWAHVPGYKRGETWNPTRGCKVLSPGCKNCYAMRTARRFSGPGKPYEGLTVLRSGKPAWSGAARLVAKTLGEPLRTRVPTSYFVDSMSDLFYEGFSDDEIAAVFGVMAACPKHLFIVLTKRAERAAKWFDWAGSPSSRAAATGSSRRLSARQMVIEAAFRQLPGSHHDESKPHRLGGSSGAHTAVLRATDGAWPLRNLWMGTSVENRDCLARIDELRKVPAAVRFLSIEPLLEDLGEINLEGINWVIVGGESGSGARPMHPEWARSIRDQCRAAGVAFFFKQWGAWAPSDSHEKPIVKVGDIDLRSDGKITGKVTRVHLRDGEHWKGREGYGTAAGVTYAHTIERDERKGAEQTMQRVGKKIAGHLLDGEELRQFPEVAHVV